jgi:hypothetical protein
MRAVLTSLVVLGASLALGGLPLAGKGPVGVKGELTLRLSQKEFLTAEPILVTVDVEKERETPLPASVRNPKEKVGLHFDIRPAVKPRREARPLPLEAKVAVSPTRLYDLLEWYEFPAEGTFTVRAVLNTGSRAVSSDPVVITLRRPAPKDPERAAVDRLHHLPWSNYVTNAFCGDTFDLVKQWPKSRLARYARYWNGLHQQNKKEYDKAIASFRAVLTGDPAFVLAPDADLGILECLIDQGRLKEAADHQFAQRAKSSRETITRLQAILRERLARNLLQE